MDKLTRIRELCDYAISRNQEITDSAGYQRDLLQQIIKETDPIVSEWIRPEPRPREDWMAIPTGLKEIYVDPDGNDGDSGELQSPMKTLQAALDKATPKTNIRLKRGGVWADSARGKAKVGLNIDNPILISDYGEGALPLLGKGMFFEGNETHPIEGMYFQNFEVAGVGWTVWDDCGYFMFDNVNTRNSNLGFNISPGRVDDGYVNEHFAFFNCRMEDNVDGGIYSGAANIFIDGCHFEGNGSGWRSRNLYLAGYRELETNNIVMQRSVSKRNCPKPDGTGAGNSPHYTTHEWVNGVYIIDNLFEEIETTSGGGCWGPSVDSGRLADRGEEKFTNVVISGNTIKYCGNQCISITNADNPLIGWNDIYIDSKNKGNGIAAPGKNYETPDFLMTKGRFVFNKVHVPAGAIGMRVDLPETEIEYNEIFKLDPTAKGIVLNGTELQGDTLGTNVYS